MDSHRCNKVKDHSKDEEDYMNLRLGTPQSMAGDMSVENRTYGTKVKDHSKDEEDYMNLRLGTPQSMAGDMSVENRTYGTTHLAQKSIDTELEQGSINITIPQTSTKTPFAARSGKRALLQDEEGDYIQMNVPRKPAKHMYENLQLTPDKTKPKEMKGDEYVFYVGF
ncbi:hypothetical protein DPMN_167226 [Dreissena polymorpha]|uniref:Uncharacterized protein n=1 Tax=Dreissena polymorpha TaxID=45954 RepID=A0A9D4F108_DREPO|nr:hypothetical protein DPMN_167226 [Dreissena polymorpha]